MENELEERVKHLKNLLRIHRRNKNILEAQIASHGGMMSAPLIQINQLESIEVEIETTETELQELRQVSLVITTPSSTISRPVRLYLSTSPDLLSKQKAIVEALEQMPLSSTRIEVIPSQAATPNEASLAIAQNCDLFLGLYGEQYAPGVGNDIRAITEIEYQAARRYNKSRLIYTTTTFTDDEDQQAFLDFVTKSQSNQILRRGESAEALLPQIQADVRAQIEDHPEWSSRPPANGRVLLASLGLSPGAVMGMYHALVAEGKQPHRVVTFSTAPYHNMRQAIDICRDEFERLNVPYTPHHINAPEIEYNEDAQAFKGLFQALLQEYLQSGAEVIAGITGGRTVMGALMTMVVQTTPAADRLAMYHLHVDPEIEQDGRLPGLLRFRHDDETWRKLVSPPPEMRRLVRVPFVYTVC